MAHGCRNLAVQQVGSYLGYSGCGADALGKAARDPKRSFDGRQVCSKADIIWHGCWSSLMLIVEAP